MRDEIYEEMRDEYKISTDKGLLNIALIHTYLSEESYWAKNIPVAFVKKSIKNSLCFGIYFKQEQIGFARVISDYSTFAYLADVFVSEGFRGKGLSKWLVKFILVHPQLQQLRRFCLATRDAHKLYELFGFTSLSHPENMMEIKHNDLYSTLPIR